MFSDETYKQCQKYVELRLSGMDVIKGKNCVVKSITKEGKDTTIILGWYADDSTTLEEGIIRLRDGEGISDIVKEGEILTISLTDGTSKPFKITNGKNAEVELIEDDFSTMVKHTYYDTNGVKQEKTTQNLKANNVRIEEHENNNEYVEKINLVTIDHHGDESKITTKNIMGNQIFTGTEIVGTTPSLVSITNSKLNDLYINTDTCNLYKLLIVNNEMVWIYKGNMQGKEGKDAYEIAIEEGFIGTRAEWLESLTGEALGSEVVWDKPNIHDSTIDLRKWYYYKVDSAQYGIGSAWLTRFNIPDDKDYPPGNYAFYNGIQYLLFSCNTAIPASSQKNVYSFYVVYDERNSLCIAHFVEKSTGKETTLNWASVVKSLTVPDGYEIVTPAGVPIQYGDWVQTIYIGSSKDTAYDCTMSTGVNVSGFVSVEELKEIIGESELETNSKSIKDAINELFKLLKKDKNVKLNTSNDTVFEAINEIFNKRYVDCYELIDSDLLVHCTSDIYRTLSTNFIYCENCTSVPIGNDGWGYAMLVVSQDTYYRQVIFFDPATGKIWTNNVGGNSETGFGTWSGWTNSSEDPTPVGVIQAFYGRKYGLPIPNGWSLCDGSTVQDVYSPLYGKALPNLVGRTLAMANNESAIGSTAGSANITITRANLPNVKLSGSTTYTPSGSISSNGTHSHNVYRQGYYNCGSGSKEVLSKSTISGDPISYLNCDSAGSHNHTFTGTSATISMSNISLNGNVVQQSINNMQPTMYVDYIIKIK